MIDALVIVPAYGAERWIGECLDSIAAQVIPAGARVGVVVAIDCCDATLRAADRWYVAPETREWFGSGRPGNAAWWQLTETPFRGGELATVIHATKVCARDLTDETIMCHVCGDDYLPDPHVLGRMLAAYEPSECRPRVLLTYGSYSVKADSQPFRPGHCHAYPEGIEDYRAHPWLASHLRTYRYGLWRRIPPEQLIDPETGRTWFYATDRAMMLPMLEMARERAVFVDDVQYIYRRHDGNVPGWQDEAHCRRVAAMPQLERIEDWQ